jgi:trigger factor
MEIPGAAGTVDREALDKAQAEQERLLEELKKELQVGLKEIGVLRKELTVTVPAAIIASHIEFNYKELMHDAFVPGFRKGRAPRRLIEKRYGHDVRESLTTSVVGQAYYAALEKEKLDVLGDPLFSIPTDAGTKLVDFDEALQHLKLPESGDFSYVCEIETKPKFELPELKGIPIKTPKIEVTDAMIAEQLLQRRKMRGRFEPASDAAEPHDQIIADVILSVDGQEVKREDNVTVGVRPARLDNVPLMNLGEVLAGAKPGDTRATDCKIPDDYERPELRGKDGRFEFKIHELKRLVPEDLSDFLKAWSFEGEADALKYFREQLEAETGDLAERAKKAQVEDYLLKSTQLDLPEHFSSRQIDRAVVRHIIEMQQQGVPDSDIEARIDALRTSAKEQVARDLKLTFLLEKVAEALNLEVTDEEVNTEIARMSQLYNKRFDRVRDDLQNRGLLSHLIVQIRENKCIAHLADQASAAAE